MAANTPIRPQNGVHEARAEPPRVPVGSAWAICPNMVTISNTIPSRGQRRSEEHTSELQSLMRISYAVFCLKKKQHLITQRRNHRTESSIITPRHKKSNP